MYLVAFLEYKSKYKQQKSEAESVCVCVWVGVGVCVWWVIEVLFSEADMTINKYVFSGVLGV